MTQQEKQLLLKDLCARLPYGVIVHEKWEYQNPGVKERTKKEEDHIMNCYDLASIETIKPYLRPMSSMTEEEAIKYVTLTHYNTDDNGKPYRELTIEATDWLNENHFDYRGLIKKGLAFEASKDMYKTK